MKWKVFGHVEASTYIGVVEAKTQDEAIEKAEELIDIGLCNQCARKIADPEVVEIEVYSDES